MWSDWLVFCDYGFSVSALWCPLATPTISLGFFLPWTYFITYMYIHNPLILLFMYFKVICRPTGKLLYSLTILVPIFKNKTNEEIPGDPVVKNSPSNTGDSGWIPGWEAKILHAGQLSLCFVMHAAMKTQHSQKYMYGVTIFFVIVIT